MNQLLRAGQHAEALNKADRYLAGKPKDPQMRFLRGVVLTEAGRPDEAIAAFQKLTEDYPELPEPYNNLAVLYAGQAQFDKARAALEMAIRTNPSYATAHENLGDVYAKLASQAYSRALQLDAGNTAVQPKLALIREIFAGPGGRPAVSDREAPAPTAGRAAAPRR
ncbi:tetratricopeptide repeat protein [Ramlibacter montanisoli]|uniref:Tetratricopeptide repeat protein n=1 Tax=Ramlibacter montanisoli TaxID=2732512 RepID=A0A849K7Q4_9BURK|nr:tetratricopeptide repeat protein [Ramlibacter montanisoli]